MLFDLGVRKDTENLPPPLASNLKKRGFELTVEYNVSEILDQHAPTTGISAKSISTIIWSHHHFDHTGDVSTFPNIPLVVGPGFKKENLPAYPTNAKSSLWESDFSSRELRELDMSSASHGNLTIGQCRAYDYFNDGSFYLLSTPGHTESHICGLARVSKSPDSFILMGGDAAHNMGELRPSEYLPLPKRVYPSPLKKFKESGCPGELLQELQSRKSASEPFYAPAENFSSNHEEAMASIHNLIELDADAGVLVILAHDAALLGQIPFFPETINAWLKSDLDALTRWNFASAFGPAIRKGDVEKL